MQKMFEFLKSNIRTKLLVITLLILMCSACKSERNQYAEPPPQEVSVAKPLQQEVTNYLEFTGTTRAVEEVEVRARVSGFLQSMHFTPGTDVKKGDLLFVIDPREYQAELDAAKAELEKYAPYGTAAITPTCLRNHLMLFEMKEGRGPIIMDTVTALAELGKTMDKKELKHLESEAWEDFLDMTCGQANLWCATNTEPEKKNSEIMPTEPYLLGSHSGCCGLWTSGPDYDWVPDSYKIKARNGKVYKQMTTVEGLFTAGDGVGGSGHKFSSGSHAEGRIAAKQMVRYATDFADFTPTLKQSKEELVDLVYKPVRTFLDNYEYSTHVDFNPNYIKPEGMMYRLMKATHEYGAGTATYYLTTSKSLEVVMDLLATMREDCEKMAAGSLHELMRAWEIEHRIWTVESHLRHISFRKETRYPGFYYQADYPGQDDENWFCFTNSKYDPEKKEWDVKKVDYVKIIPD